MAMPASNREVVRCQSMLAVMMVGSLVGFFPSVEVRVGGGGSFQAAKHNWGANWMLINTSGQAFKGPYDIRVVSKLNGHAVTAVKAIPEFFEPGKLYESDVQLMY